MQENANWVKASLKGARLSAQKARIVIDAVRGRPVMGAHEQLAYSSKKAAALVKKLLESAMANAENNHSLDVDLLKIAAAYVDEGPRMKRFKSRARGRSTRIVRQTCHITVWLSDEK